MSLANLDVVPRKTERAREALKERGALPHHQRLFLIMVDGRKTLGELAEAAAGLGIDQRTLAAMAHAGLLQLRKPAGTAPAAMPSGFSDDGTAPSSLAPDVPEEPARPAPPPLPSLAAVKLYAIDLMALMLPGQDAALRESARRLTDADGMRRWLHEASAQIAARATGERATLFLDKVGAMLPPGFLAVETDPA